MEEDVIDYEEGIGVIPDVNVVGLFIHDFIILNGPSSAWRIYKAWKTYKRRQGRRGPSYQSFWRNYIWPLKKLGLLEDVGEEPGEYEGTKPAKPLVIAGPDDHPAWWDPLGYLYGRAGEEHRKGKRRTTGSSSWLEEFAEAIARGRSRRRG